MHRNNEIHDNGKGNRSPDIKDTIISLIGVLYLIKQFKCL